MQAKNDEKCRRDAEEAPLSRIGDGVRCETGQIKSSSGLPNPSERTKDNAAVSIFKMDKYVLMPWRTDDVVPKAPREIGDAPGHEKSIPERIEDLIVRTGISYNDLARTMGVTRTTVHAVRKGTRQPSRKFAANFGWAEKRLDAVRRGEGILTRRDQSLLLYAVGVETPAEDVLVPEDRIQLRLKPNQSQSEPNYVEIKLFRPSTARGMGAVTRALTHEACDELLLACFEDNYATPAFIQKISPTSYYWALKKCVQLILGPEWKEELQATVRDVDKRLGASIEQLQRPEPTSQSGSQEVVQPKEPATQQADPAAGEAGPPLR